MIGDKNMELLNKNIVSKKTDKIKIMQFGEGNFLRAFVDWIIQKMNDRKCGICHTTH